MYQHAYQRLQPHTGEGGGEKGVGRGGGGGMCKGGREEGV